ncbi:MAG TPA: class I SAM-dependent methyltransferase [Phycisphaerales bacterium]
MKLLQRWLQSGSDGVPHALPVHWLEQLRHANALGPEHAALYDALLAHARAAGIDRIVQLLDTIESPKGFGHAQTRSSGKALDSQAQPMPWITYPAFHYLDQLDLSAFRVLETGAGSSTLYWGARTREVVTIEHDPDWRRFVTRPLPANCTVSITNEAEYAAAFAAAPGTFDLIIIDGRERFSCTEAAAAKLNPAGMILLDNSEWYPNCAALLRDAGLIQIDFSGLGPVVDFSWTTSLFLHPSFRPRPRALPFPRVSPGQQWIDAADDKPHAKNNIAPDHTEQEARS